MKHQYFIAGTGTGCGKTYVSALLCRVLAESMPVTYHKPVETGGRHDSQLISKIQNVKVVPGLSFTKPASPHFSAALERKKISLQLLSKKIHSLKLSSQNLIVEGAGGLMVPLNDKDFLIDLISTSGLEVILAARAGLGTLNEVLLSVQALKLGGVKLKAVVLNSIENKKDVQIEKDNLSYLKKHLKVPVLYLSGAKFSTSAIKEIKKLF